MRFWCENCNKYFNVEETLQKYNYYLNEEIMICPSCKKDLIPIARKTELSLSFDADTNQLTCVEYDSSNYDILKSVNINIEETAKPIIHYMKSINKESLNLNGITITRSDDMSTKSILKNIDIKDENSAEKLISALEESEDKQNSDLDNKDLKLYYIAEELIHKGEFVHLYMHRVCTKKEAKDWVDRMKKESIEQLKISEEDIDYLWYEAVDVVEGNYYLDKYKVNLSKCE
ncbi:MULTISPECIES: hypothetical protein [unclassified Clostridioides]|uniref:hypothetical protein n=1 Tax=unclassified Clostridioides TaxID=2635829 RepID=UPI001D0F7CAF|nr:hypothetical protein [Clostridioides sp. ES-W-0018-02]MCC0713020.1 hypothetical protein [Clostridioides sp. ES-W-0017-02]